MLETVISGITQIGFFGWGVALLSCLFRNQTGRKMGIIGVAIGIASIVTIYILRVSGPWGLLSGSGTDVSHVFVRFFAVVSGVFCLKKCCVFFELLLCVLGSFCS